MMIFCGRSRRSEAGHREAETRNTDNAGVGAFKNGGGGGKRGNHKARIAKSKIKKISSVRVKSFCAEYAPRRKNCAGRSPNGKHGLVDMDKEKHEILFSADNSEELFSK